MENAPELLHIAVTGEAGSGKSTFVNAFRGLNDDDEGAAPTGCEETTKEVKKYPHPKYPNVTLWDLPGIGTTKFSAKKYLKHVGYEKFDFFIIVSSDRFRENDVKLFKEIQKMKKKFYFVRSKIDHNLHDEKRKMKNKKLEFKAETVLDQIRKNCSEDLQKQGLESPQVFLVSSLNLELYDFPLLGKILELDLPAHKRNALLEAMSNISQEDILNAFLAYLMVHQDVVGMHHVLSQMIVMERAQLGELARRGVTGKLVGTQEFSNITLENPLECQSTEHIKKALENNNLALALVNIQEYLVREKNTPLHIAVTGEAGSGKSTFVNAFRGLDDGDEGAAATGCVETTVEVKPYPHPKNPNVTLWDLPGIGTTKFPADKYLQHVGFERFDFFIIVSSDRFRENDVKLFKDIQKMKKKFYFVRSKVDHNLQDEERKMKKKKLEFKAETVLDQIRKNCTDGLQQQGVESPQVFLVSSLNLDKYDFSSLLKVLEGDLPAQKKNVLLMAMPNISLEVINKKKEAFHARIKYLVLVSAGGAAAPLPGVSLAVDMGILVGAITKYVFGFGLDIPSLKSLANRSKVPLEDLLKVIVSPLAADKITPELVMKAILPFASIGALIAAEEVSRFIPVLGILVSVPMSTISTYKILEKLLDVLAEDAQRVFKRALGLETSV